MTFGREPLTAEHQFRPEDRVWVRGSGGIGGQAATVLRLIWRYDQPGYVVQLDDGQLDHPHVELVFPLPHESERQANPSYIERVPVVAGGFPGPYLSPQPAAWRKVSMVDNKPKATSQQERKHLQSEQYTLFLQQLPQLMEAHAGEYVVFHEGEPLLFRGSRREATDAAVVELGAAPWIVQPVAYPRSQLEKDMRRRELARGQASGATGGTQEQ